MQLRYIATKLACRMLPPAAIALLKDAKRTVKQARLAALRPLEERDLIDILANRLEVEPGDTVFVHSSVDQLQPAFRIARLLPLLEELVGKKGNLLFPTYPRVSSSEFLGRGMVFDICKTPSFTGLLTELARRHAKAVRSLHPTKSVCAIGPLAHELTREHQCSPFPYDHCSPYYKLVQLKGKVIGLGVSTTRLSFVHCVDDALKQEFPVRPYHERIFEARCINYDRRPQIVRTYAHDMRKMRHDVPRFVRTHIPPEICQDLSVAGRKFFRVRCERLFAAMLDLAQAGFTIYPRAVYSKQN